MKIDELPIEMLIKIFSYLLRYDDVSLVNKLFYRVACKTSDPSICLRVDDSLFKREWLHSVTNSTREISKVVVDIKHPDQVTLRNIILIIEHFSASIKSLSILSSIVNILEFLQILSLVPNLEHLAFNDLYLSYKYPWKEEMFGTDELNLPKLKKVCFKSYNNTFLSVLNRLPEGVLTELDFEVFNSSNLLTLFKRQKNIKKLVLGRVHHDNQITADIFDNLQLESLELYCLNFSLATVLSKQTKLKSLTLPHGQVDKKFMEFLSTQFSELKTFSMVVYSAAPIVDVSSLKSVNDLSLSIYCMDQLRPLTKLHNPGITALTLPSVAYTVNLIQALAKSVPNLKVLKINSDINIEVFNAFRLNFNFVEILNIQSFDGFVSTDGNYFNPKLMELTIYGNRHGSETVLLNNLIANYPNLKKFEVKLTLPFFTAQLTRILNGFLKLESLKLLGGSWRLTINDLNYLKNNKNNLKYVASDVLGVKLTDKVKRQLSPFFGVMLYSKGILQIAVDINTMNSERIF